MRAFELFEGKRIKSASGDLIEMPNKAQIESIIKMYPKEWHMRGILDPESKKFWVSVEIKTHSAIEQDIFGPTENGPRTIGFVFKAGNVWALGHWRPFENKNGTLYLMEKEKAVKIIESSLAFNKTFSDYRYDESIYAQIG